MNTRDRVYTTVSNIPRGKVATYGQIGALTGINNPRVVGTILHKNPDSHAVPCYRVVNSEGRLARNYAFGGVPAQRKKLQKDGIAVTRNTVDLKEYAWRPR